MVRIMNPHRTCYEQRNNGAINDRTQVKYSPSNHFSALRVASEVPNLSNRFRDQLRRKRSGVEGERGCPNGWTEGS